MAPAQPVQVRALVLAATNSRTVKNEKTKKQSNMVGKIPIWFMMRLQPASADLNWLNNDLNLRKVGPTTRRASCNQH